MNSLLCVFRKINIGFGWTLALLYKTHYFFLILKTPIINYKIFQKKMQRLILWLLKLFEITLNLRIITINYQMMLFNL